MNKNDYMFRAVLQANNNVLRSLICSLLHLAESEVASVKVTNPIILGDAINSKEFRLDIHLLLNDSPTLYVADLTRIDLATEEDKRYHIDGWARLFKANTWEELRMTASEDEALYEAAKTLFYQSSDEEIRMRCLDREEYYQDLKNYERKIEQDRLEYEQDLQRYEHQIEQDRLEYEHIISTKDRTISEQTTEIERLRAELAELKG